jgi:hypothetical protein
MMIMAKRNAKGQFVKRSGGSKARRSGGSRALVLRETVSVSAPQRRSPAKRRVVAVKAHRGSKRHHHHGHRGITPLKLVGTALVLGSAAETNTGPLGPSLYNLVQKLPGTKTFGGAVTAGLYLGGTALAFKSLARSKLGPWLKAAGVVGIVGAGLKIGAAGTKFQWLGGQQDPYMHVR